MKYSNYLYRATIAIDFDGTITQFSKFPKTGNVRPSMCKFLHELVNRQYRLVLNTARSGLYYAEALEVLKKHNLYGLFDWQYLQDASNYGEHGKLKAGFYLDDSACLENFDDINYDKLLCCIDKRIAEKKAREEQV